MARSSHPRFGAHGPRWAALSLAVVVAAVGGLQAAPWAAASTSSGERAIFEPLPPARILDTRSPSNPLGPAESRVLQVTGAGGVPADATAVVLNVTAVSPTATGYLTLYPADAASVPNVSNVNFSAGQVVPNSVTVRLSPTGAVKIFNSAGRTHVIVDVGGYYRGHDHDDRYYAKAQTQARTAANSLTCPAGSFLGSVAADGTPSCGAGAPGPAGPQGAVGPQGPAGLPATTTVSTVNGPIGFLPAVSGPASTFQAAGPRAHITTAAGQTVLASISGVFGASIDSILNVEVCYSVSPAAPIGFVDGGFLSIRTKANVQQVVTSTLPIQLPAGTYDIGLCENSTTAFFSNDYANGAVTVFG